MEVRAVVVDSCTVSATPMEFELGNLPGSSATAQATVALDCNAAAAYEVALDAGSNSGGGERRMVDTTSGATLAYEIFRDAARVARWGNALGVDTVAGTADASGRAIHRAYGAISPANKSLTPGTYSDAVVVTVHF